MLPIFAAAKISKIISKLQILKKILGQPHQNKSSLKPYGWSGGIKKIVLFLLPLFSISPLSKCSYSHSLP